MPVEAAVLNRLGQVLRPDLLGTRHVRNRPADFENLVVGAGGEVQFVHGGLQQIRGGWREDAELLDLAVAHLGVGEQAAGFQARVLTAFRRQDPALDRLRGLPVLTVSQLELSPY